MAQSYMYNACDWHLTCKQTPNGNVYSKILIHKLYCPIAQYAVVWNSDVQQCQAPKL